MEMEKNKKNRYEFDFTLIGLDIKTFREAQKITREKLAETLDISPRHLQAIELEGKHPTSDFWHISPQYSICLSTRTYFQRKQMLKVPCGNAWMCF